MTDSPDPLIPDYEAPKVSRARIVGRFIVGALFAFTLMFVAIFIAGAASFEDKTVWWAWPLAALPVILCGVLAYRDRNSHPGHSAGLVTGVALGLLLAGLCFMGH
jgi:hypothetical protein